MVTGKSGPQGGVRVSLSVALVLGFYALLGAVALAWRWGVDGVLPWVEAPGEPLLPIPWRLGAGLAAGALLVVVSRVTSTHSRAGRTLADELGRLLGPLSLPRAWLFAAASGLAEEAFFRGALQPRVGWLAATLLFAAAHFVPSAGLWSWALFALFAGALFGALFAATGDLLAPLLAHVLVNALNLRWLAKRGGA
jgi:CAAX protease family protein